MLVALNETQVLTYASEVVSRDNKKYFCPCCKSDVILKKGLKTIPHFAHKSLIDCQVASENESITHMQGKLDLFGQAKMISENAQIEQYFEKINQRADVAFEFEGSRYAFEFQCSNISVEILTDRTFGYESIGIIPVWIFNEELLKRSRDGSYKMNSMLQGAILSSATLFFYDVKRKRILVLSEINPFSRTIFFAKERKIPLGSLSPNYLFKDSNNKLSFYKKWNKRRARYLNGIRYEGLKTPFHRQLYESGIYVQDLPYYIGIPLRNNFLLNTPPIEWQGILFIELLKNKSMTKSEIIHLWNCKIDAREIIPSLCAIKNEIDTELVLTEFMSALLYARFIKKVENKFILLNSNSSNGTLDNLIKFLAK